MTLTVITGASVSGDSYVSTTDAQAFLDARDLSAVITDGLLLRAMDSLSGVRLCEFPSNEIPNGVISAQIWLAYYVSQGSDPSALPTPAIKSETVDVISIDYAVNDGATTLTSPLSMPNVRDALRGLTCSARGIDRA